MAIELTLPRLGQGMESGTIVRWLKSEGEHVAKGEPLYELDTEKVTQEVESDAEGVLLRILTGEGEEVPVGQPVAVIGEPGEEAPAASTDAAGASAAVPAPTEEPAPAVASAPGAVAEAPTAQPVARGPARTKASPLARRMAKERGIDLAAVRGTGPEGRIVAEDIERAAAGDVELAVPAVLETPAAPPAPPPAVPAPLPAVGLPPAVEVVALSRMRKTIARRMSKSWQAPHFQVSMTADVERMIELRETLGNATPEGGVRPTYSDVVTKLVAVALMRNPAMNAHYAGEEVVRYAAVNIGLAIAVEDGLVVPVIAGCERRTIAEIAVARQDLVERSRSGSLTAADFDGGTFTISNLGMYGVERFVAVLNPPQVGILAVGAIESRAVVDDGEIVVRPRMELTLSCDHRAVDGAQASEFLATIKQLLQQPTLGL
ncbi:MAG: dihydrolipoamide acetyltransferase family protein [Actinomycetia bacterium]|nr:dihydrolipoamide acetyltransferase family protein [Actinomycetes bacterium]